MKKEYLHLAKISFFKCNQSAARSAHPLSPIANYELDFNALRPLTTSKIYAITTLLRKQQLTLVE